MRLGFWNRLALVLAVPTIFFFPDLYINHGDATERALINDAQIDCMNRADPILRKPISDLSDPHEYERATHLCEQTAASDVKMLIGPFWPRYRELVWQMLWLVAGLYVSLWLLSLIARWVWAGREQRGA